MILDMHYDSVNDTITIKFIYKLKVNEIDNVDINARVEYNNNKNEYYELVKRGIDILSFDYKVKIKTIKTVTLPHLDDNKNNDDFIINLYDKDKSDFYDIENEKLIIYEDEVKKFIKDARFEVYTDALSGNQLLINTKYYNSNLVIKRLNQISHDINVTATPSSGVENRIDPRTGISKPIKVYFIRLTSEYPIELS